MKKKIDEVIQVACHRNGVSGAPFHAVLFKHTEEQVSRLMVASVFTQPGHVAIYDVLRLSDSEYGVAFGTSGNSWRGDFFEKELREAIAEYENE